jgi:hypothetical protein
MIQNKVEPSPNYFPNSIHGNNSLHDTNESIDSLTQPTIF